MHIIGEMTEKGQRRDLRHQFFVNLLLLDMNTKECEEKYNVSVGEWMFDKSNVRGMEVVVHFLLSRILPQETSSAFKDVFPVSDTKHAREFRRMAFEILHTLEQTGVLPRNSVLQSHLQTCMGSRFIRFVFDLSIAALRAVMEREFHIPAKKTVAPETTNEAVLKLHIHREARRFVDKAQTLLLAEQMWRQATHRITSVVRDLLKAQTELNAEQSKFDVESGRDERLFGEEAHLDRVRILDVIREVSSSLRSHWGEFEKTRRVVEGVESLSDECVLNGDELHADHGLSESLSSSLPTLIQSFNFSVASVQKRLVDLHVNVGKSLRVHVERHTAYVTALQRFEGTLRSVLADVERCKEKLEEISEESIRGKSDPSELLIPPTPHEAPLVESQEGEKAMEDVAVLNLDEEEDSETHNDVNEDSEVKERGTTEKEDEISEQQGDEIVTVKAKEDVDNKEGISTLLQLADEEISSGGEEDGGREAEIVGDMFDVMDDDVNNDEWLTGEDEQVVGLEELASRLGDTVLGESVPPSSQKHAWEDLEDIDPSGKAPPARLGVTPLDTRLRR